MLDHLRLERLTQPDALLRKGAGGGIDDANFNACVMQAVDYVSGGTGLSDIPECASHAITSYCISLNDADVFAEYRQELMALVPEIVGTARGLDTEVRIAQYAAECAKYAAECAEYAADSAEYATESAECAAVYAVKSAMSAAKSAAKSAMSAAAYAEYAAKSAAESAEYGEYAAESAESAAKSAGKSAAKSAAVYAADKRAIWNQAVTTLRGMIAIAKEVVI